MGIQEKDPLSQLSLPPGFRFYPTDEELLVQYLCRKVAGHHFSLEIIGEIDLYKFDPWVLPSKAIFGEKEWYFFSPRDRKYPNGSRPNRVAGSGYWKATGTDKIITTEGRKVGIKKALVFYIGKAPKGTKTNWIMHEYRLLDSTRKNGSSKLDDWVLCRIYKKNSSAQQKVQNGVVSSSEQYTTQYSNGSSSNSSSSHLDEVLESLPEIDDRCFALPRVNSLRALQHQHHHHQEDTKVGLLQQQQQGLVSSGAGSFLEWASGPGILNDLGQAQEGIVNVNYGNDLFVPSSNMVAAKIEEEVQSGVKNTQSSFFQQGPNPNDFTQGFSNQLDPYGFSRYPVQPVGFGFRQ